MSNLNKSKESFHILALSGGGYKGLYTAEFIAQVEKKIHEPFGSRFDLICGSSIGGILALALATKEIGAAKIVDLLQEIGPQLFHPLIKPKLKLYNPLGLLSRVRDRCIFEKTGFTWARGVNRAKHSNDLLKAGLTELFGDRTTGDLKTRVLIPSVNWTKGGPQFFKTPHNPRFDPCLNRSLVDVAMATSAAPVYLPNYRMENQIFVDGGLVGNAPGIFGIHEAENSIPEARGKAHSLLSIGALSSKIATNQSLPVDKGLIQWKVDLFNLILATQEQTADHMLSQKMGDSYSMIDEQLSSEQIKIIALDKADSGATETLLGIARHSFQDNISKPFIEKYLEHSAPNINFHSQGVATNV